MDLLSFPLNALVINFSALEGERSDFSEKVEDKLH